MKHHQDFSKLLRNAVRRVLRLRTTTPGALVLVAVLPFMLGFRSCVVDKPVAGTRLSVNNYPDAPSRNSLFFLSEDVGFPLGDPTMNGASLTLSNPITGQFEAYDLPAHKWEVLPEPARGYRYIDVRHAYGPCEYLVLTDHRLIATCRGNKLHFRLDELHQEALHVQLIAGAPHGTRYCASFGGDVMRDTPMTEDHVGRFLAAHAPAPADCDS